MCVSVFSRLYEKKKLYENIYVYVCTDMCGHWIFIIVYVSVQF